MAYKFLKAKPFFRKISLYRPRLYSQKIKYGFDEREIYSLDHTFYLWLEERLKMFLEKTGETYYYLDIKFYSWKDEIWTTRQLINEILERTVLVDTKEFTFLNLGRAQYKYVNEIPEIWALIHEDIHL